MTPTPFSIQFLGSGNAWSKPPINYNTNAIVRANGRAWLIDCGLLCPLALKDHGISQCEIDAVFISHLHGDHVLGLEELLFTRFFACAQKHSLWIPEPFLSDDPACDGSHIWNNCLRAAMETSIEGRNTPLTLSDYADIHTLRENTPFNMFGLQCAIFSVDHAAGKPAFGLVIENRAVFTSDTKFNPQRIVSHLENGIETIFHETTFLPPFAGNIHTSFDDLARLPRDICEHIVLMHYSDLTTQEQFRRAQNLGFRIARPGQAFSFGV